MCSWYELFDCSDCSIEAIVCATKPRPSARAPTGHRKGFAIATIANATRRDAAGTVFSAKDKGDSGAGDLRGDLRGGFFASACRDLREVEAS